jgi:DNA-binding FadR family transcriptional regulator
MTTWKEQLAFAPLENADRGVEVGRRLRHAIELGVLEDGSQLPSESYLASRMGVSTLTLRAALAELRGLGLVETRRGKGGGSFVKANTGDIARVQRQSLAAYSLEDLRDLREYRAFLAGSAAAAAAAANGSHRLSMGRLVYTSVEIRDCEHAADAIRADSKFHIELAASSGSVRLTRQEVALQAEVGPLIWVDPAGHKDAAAEDHTKIVEAIRAGDVASARALAEEHVRRDMNVVIDERMELDRTPTDSPQRPASVDGRCGRHRIAHRHVLRNRCRIHARARASGARQHRVRSQQRQGRFGHLWCGPKGRGHRRPASLRNRLHRRAVILR